MSTAFLLIAVLLIIPAAGMANQVQLGFLPSTQSASVGSFVQIALGISLLNIGEPPSLGAYDLNVLFDPTLLDFNAVAFGDPVLGNQLDLFGLGNIQSVSPGIGTVNLFELSLDSSSDLDLFQAGDFTLFTLTFSTLAPGTSTVDLTVNALSDSVGTSIESLSQNGSVTVTEGAELPEPASLTLIALGLGLLAVKRTRRRRDA